MLEERIIIWSDFEESEPLVVKLDGSINQTIKTKDSQQLKQTVMK